MIDNNILEAIQSYMEEHNVKGVLKVTDENNHGGSILFMLCTYNDEDLRKHAVNLLVDIVDNQFSNIYIKNTATLGSRVFDIVEVWSKCLTHVFLNKPLLVKSISRKTDVNSLIEEYMRSCGIAGHADCIHTAATSADGISEYTYEFRVTKYKLDDITELDIRLYAYISAETCDGHSIRGSYATPENVKDDLLNKWRNCTQEAVRWLQTN